MDEWHFLCLPVMTMEFDFPVRVGTRDLKPGIGFGGVVKKRRF